MQLCDVTLCEVMSVQVRHQEAAAEGAITILPMRRSIVEFDKYLRLSFFHILLLKSYPRLSKNFRHCNENNNNIKNIRQKTSYSGKSRRMEFSFLMAIFLIQWLRFIVVIGAQVAKVVRVICFL